MTSGNQAFARPKASLTSPAGQFHIAFSADFSYLPKRVPQFFLRHCRFENPAEAQRRRDLPGCLTNYLDYPRL
jgi:hypothetical protein